MVSDVPGTDEYLQIKLCGYGLSSMRSIDADDEWANRLQHFAGTQEYMAPEIFLIAQQHKPDGHLGHAEHEVDAMGTMDDDAERALAREMFEREFANKQWK